MGDSVEDEVKLHTDRAMAELALASSAADPQAARAHLRLASLHLDVLRDLCASASAPLSRTAGQDAA
jgi:hypothetical protein